LFSVGYAPSSFRILQNLKTAISKKSSETEEQWSLWNDIRFHSLTSWFSNRALRNGSDPAPSMQQLVELGMLINATNYKIKSPPLHNDLISPIYDRFRYEHHCFLFVF
jgi:hypothetical protein